MIRCHNMWAMVIFVDNAVVIYFAPSPSILLWLILMLVMVLFVENAVVVSFFCLFSISSSLPSQSLYDLIIWQSLLNLPTCHISTLSSMGVTLGLQMHNDDIWNGRKLDDFNGERKMYILWFNWFTRNRVYTNESAVLIS